jgi:hypothetical protein
MSLGRSRLYKFGIIPVSCLIIAVGFVLFGYESKALLWHVTHGSTYQWQGLIIAVPLMYDVNAGSSRSIQVFTMPGRLRARRKAPFGIISIIHAQSGTEGSEIGDLDKQIELGREKQGFRLISSRPIEVAGTRMQCQERLAENFRSYGPASSVRCQAENELLFVEFEGSPALLNEFYSLAGEIGTTNVK